MSKFKKLMSVSLAAVMVISLLSCFCLTSAAGAADVDKLIYSPFTTVNKNPGYGSVAPSGVVFVCSAWNPVANGQWVFMNYSGQVYKAVKGVNAFGNITEALDKCETENLKIKVGPGNYTESSIKLNKNGLKFYGNYAGTNPNVMGDKPYVMDLNPVRNPDMESVINGGSWNWTIGSNNISLDGFKITGMTGSGTSTFNIAVSGALSEYFSLTNSVIEGNTGTVFNANRGRSNGTYIKYCRFVNNSGVTIQYGGAMSDTVLDYNYFENNAGMLYAFTSCGNNNDQTTLVSFSYNIVNNCMQGLNFNYDNSNFGANLDYKRVVGNYFYSSGSNTKYNIRINLQLEYMKNAETDTSPTACNDPGCKTFISENIFDGIPNGVTPVKIEGGQNLSGRTVNFTASVVNNKFLYPAASTSRIAIYSTLIGTVDASRNFYGSVASNGKVTRYDGGESLYNVNEDTRIITMPYYLDEEMTTLSGGVQLKKASNRLIRANGFETAAGTRPSGFEVTEFTIDNDNFSVTATARAGFETVNFNDVIMETEYTLYNDFMLTKPVPGNKLNLTDTQTRAYLVAKDKLTGSTVKFDVVVKAETDKTKNEIRYIIDGRTNDEFENYAIDGTNVNISLASKDLYFPFSLTVSPSASYQLFTDEGCTSAYSNPTNYVEPDKELVIYAKVVSGDGSNTTVYKLIINRPGAVDYEARILSVISPQQDILVFNNERKSISYRPFAMVDSAEFDFNVSTNATYEIYKNYNPETGEVSELLSKQGDVRAIPIGDGISYFYVKVTSIFGFSQVYTLVAYNDVKSTDNVITGISGMPNVPIKDNVIYLEISSTLAAVNARFETNAFADVVVYADPDKQYKLKPSITYSTINNREVEVRTFRLGATCQVSYFYVDVTSEVGETNSYKVVITKGATTVPFKDIENHWSREYVQEAARLGIVGGYHDADTDTYTFEPNRDATRQEVAAMFCRMMGIDPLSFNNEVLSGVYKDSDSISEWAYNYVKAAYFLNIMTGSINAEGDREFRCKDKITRQEFFQAMSNLLKLDTAAAADCDLSRFKDADKVGKWAIPATKAVVKAGIIEGADGCLNPRDNIKRGEIAKIVSIINIISPDVK